MTDNEEFNKDDVKFLKNLFGTSSASKEKKKKKLKEEKEKEPCPYCGKLYKSVGRQNPKNQESSPELEQGPSESSRITRSRRRRVLIEEEMVERTNWSELIEELKPLLSNLTRYIKKLNQEPLKVQIVSREE
ncbi:MAG: hypothetical protein ACOC44_02285 [Promethearchaeia archaeon]